jgi:dienelactone hydrolase
LNSYGVSAILLKYRVPQRPSAAGEFWAAAQLMDAQRAMGVARSNAATWGIDASRIGFLGFSAGGHLTARISTNWAQRLYARVDSADDLPCRPDFSLLIYPWKLLDGDNASATSLSPELVVNSSHPTAFLAQNMDDTTAHPENTLMYARQLHLTGAPKPTVHLYPAGGHGFGVCAERDPVGGFEMCCEWTAHAQRFLQYLGNAPGWPNTTDGA